jgi:hypothetical protein
MQVRHASVSFEDLRLSDIGTLPEAVTSAIFFPRKTGAIAIGTSPLHPSVEFDTPPTQVAAFLSGFQVRFEEGEDRELGNLEVRLGEPIKNTDTNYSIPVTFGLRDWSGDWDDRHGAEIHITVVGD